jgi:hypothetical protein
MTGWDVLDKIIMRFPPVALVLLLIASIVAVVIFITGFSRHGINFIKYGFAQSVLGASIEKRFDQFDLKFEVLNSRFEELNSRIDVIETNHFGHLKNYLEILTGVLLDKDIINNETRARMDNELRGM